MPTNIVPVSFMSPQAQLAPDLAVDQQQIDRRQQLAAALRQMSMDPIDAGKGNIAWTQGAAKLAQSLAAVIVARRADKQQRVLNNQFANGPNGKPFGYYDPPPGITPAPPVSPTSLPSSGTGAPPPASRPVDPQAAPATINVPDNPSMRDPAPVVQRPSPTMPEPGQPDALAPLPDAPSLQPQPQMASPQQQAPQMPPQKGAFHPGPWSMTNDPVADRQRMMLDPQEYQKQLLQIAAKGAAPTDVEVLQSHLQQAVTSGNMGAAQAIMAQLNKVNRLPMESTRPGAPFFDPNTDTWHFAPKLGDGEMPTMDSNGNISSVNMLPGAVDAMRQKAAADAAGKAGYTPTQVLGNDGNYHSVPLASLPGFGGGNPPPAGNPAPAGLGATTPGRSGTLGGYFTGGGGAGGPPANSGNVSGLGPKGQTAATASGTNSANAYQAAIDAGQSAPDALRSLDQIMVAAKNLPTGTGAGALSTAKSGFNALADGLGITSQVNPIIDKMGLQVGFDRDRIAKFDELKKQVSQLASQVSSGPGSTGTDARLNNAIAALPGSNYSPAAIQEVSLNLKARTQSKKDFGIAAAQDMATNGAENYPNFAAQWQRAYNPDLYYQMQKGPAAFSQWFKSIPSATARAHVLQQYRTLKAMGAFQ